VERAVTFRNERGQKLFGIIHVPEPGVPLSGTGVNLLNPGLKNRVAPNRINIRIARMLCARGFPVLRFDPHGIGDSEGELAAGNELNLDLWGQVQRGAFVADTLAADDFFVREARLERLVLVGQCGGAVTALLAAGRDERVAGTILVDLPVRDVSTKLEGDALRPERRGPDRTGGDAPRRAHLVRAWSDRIRRRTVFPALRTLLARTIGSGSDDDRPAPAPGASGRFLWPVREACDGFRARGGWLSFVFAERDFAIKEFSQDLLPFLREKDGTLPKGVTMQVVKDANHIYTEEAWRKELLALVDRFMNENSRARTRSLPGA
jgi:pimeloyl-ACP methyl ester carboxylesterase